ncbi:hypothetical protein V6N13_014160 [Hibiscus sabdariffa]|uniref:Uncharacterized protein n=1 Tax=Hibiscus sabdariffa TaxID=183260 RepID=A0ABR2RUM4_9ROSI
MKELKENRALGFSVMRVAASLILVLFDNVEIRRSVLEAELLEPWLEKVTNWSPEIGVLEMEEVVELHVEDSSSESEDNDEEAICSDDRHRKC